MAGFGVSAKIEPNATRALQREKVWYNTYMNEDKSATVQYHIASFR